MVKDALLALKSPTRITASPRGYARHSRMEDSDKLIYIDRIEILNIYTNQRYTLHSCSWSKTCALMCPSDFQQRLFAWHRLLAHDVDDVVGDGVASTAATRVDLQWPVMVHKQQASLAQL